jgi:histidinol phosphatase-like PHP family hydrolase
MSDVFEAEKQLEFEWNGRTFILRRPTFATEGLFSKVLKDRSLKELDYAFGSVHYEAMVKSTSRDWATYQYAAKGDQYETAIRSDQGFQEFAYIWLRQDNQAHFNGPQGLKRSDIDTLWKDAAKKSELAAKYWEIMSPTPTMPPPEQDSAGNG